MSQFFQITTGKPGNAPVFGLSSRYPSSMEYRSFGGTSGKPFTIRFQMSNVFHRRKNSSLWRKLYLNNRHIDLCLILEWILQITEPIDQWIVSQGEVTRWIQSLSEGTAVNTSEH
eukprot:278949_1